MADGNELVVLTLTPREVALLGEALTRYALGRDGAVSDQDYRQLMAKLAGR